MSELVCFIRFYSLVCVISPSPFVSHEKANAKKVVVHAKCTSFGVLTDSLFIPFFGFNPAFVQTRFSARSDIDQFLLFAL